MEQKIIKYIFIWSNKQLFVQIQKRRLKYINEYEWNVTKTFDILMDIKLFFDPQSFFISHWFHLFILSNLEKKNIMAYYNVTKNML